MVKIDIELVDRIIQDYQNKEIDIKNKKGQSLWRRRFSSETTFNKVFREISRKFSEEVEKRELRNMKGKQCGL